MPLLKRIAKVLPTLGFAFVLAIAVWVNAETASDPNIRRIYPRAVPVQIVGLDPNVVLVDETPHTVTVEINAPQSVWNQQLTYEEDVVTAVANLSGLGPGTHTVDIKVTIKVRAAEITTVTPAHLNLTLEPLATRSITVQLIRMGEPAIGFQAGNATLSQDIVTASGPESLVSKVEEVRASLNLGDAHDSIETSVALQAIDADGNPIDGVKITPENIDVVQPITQRGGYRNVVVNVATSGEIARGYRLTNISVIPAVVVVFSANPARVNELPGYVDTLPVNIEGATDDLDVRIGLDLPTGISLVGNQDVLVRVGIAAIESSLTVPNLPIEVVGLGPGVQATLSPETIEAIVSGPMPLLDALNPGDVSIQVDLSGLGIGTHIVTPIAQVNSTELKIEVLTPPEIEVVIEPATTPAPTRRP